MSAIGPGDFVECVKASGRHPEFSVGRIYCVEWIDPSADCMACGNCDGLGLKGIGGNWASCCVRPIYRPKSSLIEQLKRPVSEPA